MQKMKTKKIKGEPETIYEKILFEALVVKYYLQKDAPEKTEEE